MSTQGAKQTATVLVVDDQKAIRETIALMLHDQGYRLEFAANGEDALEKAARVIPDVILLDVMMPGMDGFEVCRRLRAHPILGQVPIVMVTALADRTSWMKGIEAGADDFVFKPFETAELRTRVENITRLNRYRTVLVERLKFEWVIKHADDGYLMLDKKGFIIYANPKARLFLGLVMDEKITITTAFLELAKEQYNTEPRDAWIEWPQKSPSGVFRYLVRPESATSTQFWLKVSALTLPPDMGVSYVVRLRDVTEQMVLQGDVWRFHSMIFHKLRTPLISLLSNLELLVRQSKKLTPNDVGDLAKGALAGAQRLQGDLEGVLQYLKAPSLAASGDGFSLSQIQPFVTKIGTELGLKPIDLAGHSQLTDVSVALAPRAMAIVLWEILENAKKFHPKQNPTVQIFTFRPNAKEITMWIGDDGVTLSPEQLVQAWMPYYQSEKQFTGEVPGMGLGLPMVGALIWGIGGSCRIYNRSAGSGVVVELILPVQQGS